MSTANFQYTELQIRAKSIITYPQYTYPISKKSNELLNMKKNILEHKKLAYNKILSESAKKRMARAIDILCQCAIKKRIYNNVCKKYVTHRLSFITLTISAKKNISLKNGYDLGLKRFLNILRKRNLITNYIWKAEIQRRGQLHYHITTTAFVDYQIIKDVWNNIQKSNGWLEDYYNITGHYNANSTDIHAVKHVNDLSAYLIKEFVKSHQNNFSDNGKKWDCSQNLRGKKYFTVAETTENLLLIRKYKEDNKIVEIKEDRYSIINLNSIDRTALLTITQLQLYREFQNSIAKQISKEYTT